MKYLSKLILVCAALSIAPTTPVMANTLIQLMVADQGATRPSGCPSRWCACYMDLILAEAGFEQLGSWKARDFARYGEAAEPGSIGSIMVMRNHVAVVVGRCEDGRIMTISGNYSRKVSVGCERANKAIAWRVPSELTTADRPRTLADLFADN